METVINIGCFPFNKRLNTTIPIFVTNVNIELTRSASMLDTKRMFE